MSYLRRISLTVSGRDDALELGALRVRFTTHQRDTSTPNTATIRVYNVAPDTAQLIQQEYTGVVLQCGYDDGPLGTRFDGQLVQVRRGRENATDTYLDLLCTDGIKGYALSIVSATLASGSSAHDRIALLQSAFSENGVTVGETSATISDATLPRAKVMYGVARDHMDDIAENTRARWSIQNGRLTLIGDDTYLPGDIEIVSPETGMIGIPEQTQDGIKVRVLINPYIKIGGRIQIKGAVNEAALNLTFGGIKSNAFLPQLNEEGQYRVIVMEDSGDTRGQEWYSDLICLAIDGTVTPQGLINRGYQFQGDQSAGAPNT